MVLPLKTVNDSSYQELGVYSYNGGELRKFLEFLLVMTRVMEVSPMGIFVSCASDL
jgi:hypothetical protein